MRKRHTEKKSKMYLRNADMRAVASKHAHLTVRDHLRPNKMRKTLEYLIIASASITMISKK